ncbi:MAG: hypothetical protein FJZ95_08575 [Chloroflexi bacterium]|nr:hypothetical protein [Chloroflexota bacterium]
MHGWIPTRKAQMRQQRLNAMSDTEREHGFCVCQTPDGRLVKGPESVGHKYGVSVDVTCPPGARLVGMYHTHPGGVPELSEADLREAHRFNIPTMCVGVPDTGEVKCHRITK